MNSHLSEQHPLSVAFPMMSEAEFTELRADTARNGLEQPIVIFANQVLDGGTGTAPAAGPSARCASRSSAVTRRRRAAL